MYGLLPVAHRIKVRTIAVVEIMDIPQHAHSVYEMHQLRHRVFKERLGWDVTSSGGLEVDEYDAAGPTYLLYQEREKGPVRGCVRLLPTTGPYMLAETFPLLLGDRAAPRGLHVWEASRFAVDGDVRRSSKLAHGAAELIAGVHEFALMRRLAEVVVVVDVRMERVLRLAGWPVETHCWPSFPGPEAVLIGSEPVNQLPNDA